MDLSNRETESLYACPWFKYLLFHVLYLCLCCSLYSGNFAACLEIYSIVRQRKRKSAFARSTIILSCSYGDVDRFVFISLNPTVYRDSSDCEWLKCQLQHKQNKTKIVELFSRNFDISFCSFHSSNTCTRHPTHTLSPIHTHNAEMISFSQSTHTCDRQGCSAYINSIFLCRFSICSSFSYLSRRWIKPRCLSYLFQFIPIHSN